MDYEEIKILISGACTFDDANYVIEEFTDCKTTEQKIDYLKEMFDCGIVGRAGGDDIELDYRALLTSIIDRKWY